MSARLLCAVPFFAVLLGLTSPTLADPIRPGGPLETVFSDCDGYGAPSELGLGDGMTSKAYGLQTIFGRSVLGSRLLPNTTGDTTKRVPVLGRAGVEACDAALSDRRLGGQMWLRKINLMRARAMHEFAAGDVAAGMSQLDQADAAAKDNNEPFYQRSLAWDIKMLRAYGLHLQGHHAEAVALAFSAWQSRPYNRQSAGSAMIVIGANSPTSEAVAVARGTARLRPDAIGYYYASLFAAGDYDQVILLYPQLTPPRVIRPTPMSPLQRSEADVKDHETAALFDATSAAQYAYALASLGRAPEAQAAIVEARARLERATTSPEKPVSREDSRPDNGLWTATAEANEQVKKAGQSVLDAAEARVDAARAQAGGSVEQGGNLGTAPAPLRLPESALRPDVDLATLFAILPDPETPSRSVDFDKRPSFWTNQDGLNISQDSDGVTKVKLTGFKTSQSMSEEIALIHAAYLARQAGKQGLIVVGGDDTAQYSNTYMNYYVMRYGKPMFSDYQGMQTELDVVFVDPDALPPPYKNAGWRVISVNDVFAQLGSIYGAPSVALSKAQH